MSSLKTNRLQRVTAGFLLYLCVISLSAISLRAQSSGGGITGQIVDAAGGAPLSGVSVHAALVTDTAVGRHTFTNAQGKYRILDLRAGKYKVTFSVLGYRSAASSVDVAAQPATLDYALGEEPLRSEDVIVTASRRPEKQVDAPASVSVVEAAEVQDHIIATPTDAVTNVPGIDMDREGIAMATYATRSMHSVYGSDVLTMSDYHSAELPAIGGFYGILMAESPDDIDHVEVVRGPGSSMYGPDAATGVVHFITKSPFAAQGTNISVAGGERGYFEGSIRTDAAISDNLAFKVSARYLRANDWSLADNPKQDTALKNAQAAILLPGTTQSLKDSLSKIGNADSSLAVYWVEARLEAIFTDNFTGGITGGLTQIQNEVAMTEDFGGAQIQDWQYTFLQAHLTYYDLFFQAAINHDDTKSSYDLVTGGPISDRSTTYNFQLQHHWDPMEHEKLTYGADYNIIHPKTDSTLYGPDDGHANVSILGAYLQSQTMFMDNALELTLAGRVDKHSYLANPIFSPRAALVYHFSDEQLVRAMYNETYRFPTTTALYADLLYTRDAFGFGAQGLTAAGFAPVDIRYVSPYVSGMTFQHSSLDPSSYDMYSTFAPGQKMPASIAAQQLWPLIRTLADSGFARNVIAKGIPGLLAVFPTIGAPSPSQVHTQLAYLNLVTQTFDPVNAPIDISDVKPQHQRSLEFDYQGAISKSFQYEVDAYQTHYNVIQASTAALTPNVFLNSAELQKYIADTLAQRFEAIGYDTATAKGTASQIATGVATNAGPLPLGVVQPTGGATNEQHLTDVLVGTRSYLDNAIEFYGIDVMTEIKPNDDWAFRVSGSWLNKNYWTPAELQSDTNLLKLQNQFALNIPKYRASVSARYSGLTKGLSIELRDRWNDGFPMYDSYWVGDIHAAHLVDLTVNYRLQSLNDLLLTLSVTNLLNNYHQTLVGAPYIGRLALLRASYTLPSF